MLPPYLEHGGYIELTLNTKYRILALLGNQNDLITVSQ